MTEPSATNPPDLTPGASIPLPSLPNLRDLGGWPTRDGRQVRYGVLFRSTDLSKLSPPDQDRLGDLGIQTIYDFRSAAERTTEPDVVLDGVEEVALDVLADAPHAIPGNLSQLFADPAKLAAAEEQIGGRGGALRLMEASYAQIIELPSARSSYRSFYRGLLGDRRSPALFHCTTGKDRTGWAAASFLSLMGVVRDDVFAEYLLTNDQLVPALQAVFDAFVAAGGDRATLLPVLGVDRVYLERAFAAVDERYGTIEAYFADGLGIDEPAQERLRTAYLEDRAG